MPVNGGEMAGGGRRSHPGAADDDVERHRTTTVLHVERTPQTADRRSTAQTIDPRPTGRLLVDNESSTAVTGREAGRPPYSPDFAEQRFSNRSDAVMAPKYGEVRRGGADQKHANVPARPTIALLSGRTTTLSVAALRQGDVARQLSKVQGEHRIYQGVFGGEAWV